MNSLSCCGMCCSLTASAMASFLNAEYMTRQSAFYLSPILHTNERDRQIAGQQEYQRHLGIDIQQTHVSDFHAVIDPQVGLDGGDHPVARHVEDLVLDRRQAHQTLIAVLEGSRGDSGSTGDGRVGHVPDQPVDPQAVLRVQLNTSVVSRFSAAIPWAKGHVVSLSS